MDNINIFQFHGKKQLWLAVLQARPESINKQQHKYQDNSLSASLLSSLTGVLVVWAAGV